MEFEALNFDDGEDSPTPGAASSSSLSIAAHSAEFWEKLDWNNLRKFELIECAQDDDAPLAPRRTLSCAEVGGPGGTPGSLDFLDKGTFYALLGFVVLANVAIGTSELVSKEKDLSYRIACVTFVILYILELAGRLARSGIGILGGEPHWYIHWMDLGIIARGVLVEVVVPLMYPTHEQDFQVQVVSRLGIGLLILKLVTCLRSVNLTWTELPWFQWTGASVIVLNAIVMGVETDHPSPIWWWVNQAMLLFFVFEVAARIRLEGCANFFLDEEERAWNITDLLIVLFGALDLWATRIVQMFGGSSGASGLGKLMMLVRMLRLLRILRLLKLVKAVRPLYSLALGVTQAMQSIFWVLVLTMVTIYAFAILATRMIGHGLLVKNPDDLDENTKRMFQSIWDSMFTLFGVMNSQHFGDIEPLLTQVPVTKPVFVLFTICSSWALLSVMTGVVSDHMMSVREMQAQKDEQAQEDRRLWLQKNLRGIFAAADKDGSGTLGRDEYLELLRSPYHRERIQEIANMPVQDLAMMFEWLDVNGNGEIDFKELLHGCDWLNEPINGKSLLKISHAARSHCAALRDSMAKLRKDVGSLKTRQETMQDELATSFREAFDARKRLREAEDRYAEATRTIEAARDELRTARIQAGPEASAFAAAVLGHEAPPAWPSFGPSARVVPAQAAPRLSVSSISSTPTWAR